MMSLSQACEWLASTRGSIALHESLYMYPVVESVHVLTLCVFVGLAAVVDLRLMGITLRRVPASEVISRLMPWMAAGFIVMIVTGSLLFYAIPVRSFHNVFFRLKISMLIGAGLNAWVFHRKLYRNISEWDNAPHLPARVRAAGAVSLLLWAIIIVSGRMIAYNWFDCDRPHPAMVEWAAGCDRYPH
jgi:hypothetical protein